MYLFKNLYLYELVTGFMWRFLLIVGIVGYILYKVGSFFFKIGAASQQMRDKGRFNTPDQASKKGNDSKIKGGDYVDYEEVK